MAGTTGLHGHMPHDRGFLLSSVVLHAASLSPRYVPPYTKKVGGKEKYQVLIQEQI